MLDCPDCGKQYSRPKNLESHRRAEHPTEAERRILVDGLSPDPPTENVVPIDRPAEFIDGIELVDEPALSQAGFFNHPDRAAERARLNREVAEKLTSDQKPVGDHLLATAERIDPEEEIYAVIDPAWEEVRFTEEERHLAAVPEPVVRSHPAVHEVLLPQPAPRRHFDQVKHRCWDGFPEPMDAKWLLKRVEEADSLLRVLAQPHVLAEWNRSLSE